LNIYIYIIITFIIIHCKLFAAHQQMFFPHEMHPLFPKFKKEEKDFCMFKPVRYISWWQIEGIFTTGWKEYKKSTSEEKEELFSSWLCNNSYKAVLLRGM
jgi:hypothetical protein